MTRQSFIEIFNKIYSKSEGNIYVFKTAYGLIMLGEAAAAVERRAIGTGITPDTYIGIRLIDEEVFYIRDADSEMVYDCSYENLGEYNEKNPAEKIFHLINRITKSINVKGAQILFLRDCGYLEMSGYRASAAIGFSHIFCENQKPDELLNMIIPDNADFAENAKELISITANQNVSALIENRIPIFFPVPLSGYKIIIALTGEKPFKKPDFKKIIKDIEAESGEFSNIESFTEPNPVICSDLPEYRCAMYIKSEAARITSGAACLKNGDLSGFGELVKQSSAEYLEIAGQEAKNIELLFSLAAVRAVVCGIYKERGIYSIVQNDEVDSFVDNIGIMYEKKAGRKPEFYICASSYSGEVRN